MTSSFAIVGGVVALGAMWRRLLLAAPGRTAARSPTGHRPARPLTTVLRVTGPRRLLERRARSQRERLVVGELPELVDLVHVAITAGLTPSLALQAATDHAPPRLRGELERVAAEVSVGAPLADALAAVPTRLGEPARPLVAVLVDAIRYGTPIGASLDRLAADARASQRRAAEERARRVPVLLLFPLVTCILPAFGLLTVVPLVAGGVRALRL